MSGKFFLDTTIFLVLFDTNKKKSDTAFKLLSQKPVISTQVINESVAVLVKKFKFKKETAIEAIQMLKHNSFINSLTETTVDTACFIFVKYGFSYYDCVIIASALESKCDVLYSEDMQHKQVIENKLTIINPFLPV